MDANRANDGDSAKCVVVNPKTLPYPTPCGDCGESHVAGDHVAVYDTAQTVVWEGCIRCWVRRTSPEAVS